MRARLHRIAVLVLAALVASCGIPRDPEDSLTRIRRTGVLRAGFTEHAPWVTLNGSVAGPEARVVEAFARSLGARVEWTRGAETQLFEALEHFDIDVAVGGFDASNPWMPKLGATRPYVEADDKQHVVALPPGENGLIVAFERVLRAHAADVATAVGGTPVS